VSRRLVFLTGATGFIGGRLAGALAQRGDSLRCLVRAGSRSARLRQIGAEIVEGEITDTTFLAHAMSGVDAALHLAALYDIGVVDASEMEHVNVDGTRAFLSAVEKSGVRRAIHVSTTAALGPVAQGEGDENSAYKGPFPTVYHRTKTEAHRLAKEAQARGLPLIIVCPALVYGPGDAGPGGRFIRDVILGRMPGLLSRPGWYSYVHVDDVVAGIAAALDRGILGATYVLSGEPLSVNEFAKRVAALANRRPPPLRMPASLALATGAALDVVSRITGLRFGISREAVKSSAGLRWLHSHDRAMRELDWKPRPLSEGLPETVRSYPSR
jgi:nucleoside-diphosphate-sugar epimerase